MSYLIHMYSYWREVAATMKYKDYTIVCMYLWCEHSATVIRYKGIDICTIAHVELIETCLLEFLHILLLQCVHNSRVQAGPLYQVAGCVKHQLYCSIADGHVLTYNSC